MGTITRTPPRLDERYGRAIRQDGRSARPLPVPSRPPRPPRATWSWLTLLGLLVHLFGPPRRETGSASWSAYLALLVCLAVTALLTSARIVRIVESQPHGPLRTLAVPLAQHLDAFAQAAGFDRPARWIDRRLERPPAPPAAPLARPSTATSPAPPGDLTPTTPEPSPATPQPVVDVGPAGGTPPAETPATEAPPAETPATETPATETPARRTITAEAPLRVHVAGDSFAEWLGYDIAGYGAATHHLTVRLDFRLSSGLANPAFFNWPAHLAAVMAGESPPETVVLFLGANDFEHLSTGSGVAALHTPAWQAEYARRAGEVMDAVGAGGARLYWVSMPIQRDDRRTAAAAAGNAAAAEAAAGRPWVQLVDIWDLFAGPDGRYAAFLPGPNGQVVRVRQDDGIHLTRAGTSWVAARVHAAIQHDWQLPAG